MALGNEGDRQALAAEKLPKKQYKQRLRITSKDYYCYYYFFNLRTAAFKAYCAIWVRRSNFRHQAPRVSPRESTRRRKVELWTRNGREFCLNVDFHVTFRGSITCRKATTWGRRFSFPSEGRRAEDFFALKMRTRELGYQRPARYL